MNLTTRQKSLLKDLLGDDAWVSLLEQIESDREVRPWQSGGEQSEQEKNSKWIYESGIKRGVSDILIILRLNT